MNESPEGYEHNGEMSLRPPLPAYMCPPSEQPTGADESAKALKIMQYILGRKLLEHAASAAMGYFGDTVYSEAAFMGRQPDGARVHIRLISEDTLKQSNPRYQWSLTLLRGYDGVFGYEHEYTALSPGAAVPGVVRRDSDRTARIPAASPDADLLSFEVVHASTPVAIGLEEAKVVAAMVFRAYPVPV